MLEKSDAFWISKEETGYPIRVVFSGIDFNEVIVIFKVIC